MDERHAEGSPGVPQPGAERPDPAGNLEHLSDDELRAVASRAKELLKQREKERRDGALREIRKIAREHGLQVEVKSSKRGRGRPTKSKGGGGA